MIRYFIDGEIGLLKMESKEENKTDFFINLRIRKKNSIVYNEYTSYSSFLRRRKRIKGF